MKNRKSSISLLIIILVLVLACLCGCSSNGAKNGLTIVSIEKTETNGLKDTYTITYSDGSEYSFEITNGEDCEGCESLTIDAIYDKYLEIYPDATYEDFLADVLDVNLTSNTRSINKALQSSAKIYTEFTETYRVNPIYTTKETAVYLGSAVVYKVDSDYTYFITNYHVVYDSSATGESKIAKNIVCYLYGSEDVPVSTNTKDENGCTVYEYGEYGITCEYVGGSITADIALVKAKTSEVKAINENVKAITFAEEYCVGDTAIAIGNPEGEGISVTEGIVSVDNEYIYLAIDGVSRAYRSIRIDTSIYSGSSGGGLFDVNGNLIGITNAGDGQDQNVNYAIPLEIVKSAVENIMYYDNNAKIITLGIQVTSSNSKYVFDSTMGKGKIVETIAIAKVNAGSISEKMGLKEGDVLLSFIVNGVEYTINRSFNIGDILMTIRSGDSIAFNLSRADQTLTSALYTVMDSDLNQVA